MYEQSTNHISLKNWPESYLNSSAAQDAFQPIPGFINCAGVTGRWGLLCQHWCQVMAHRPCSNSRRTTLLSTVSEQLVHVLYRLAASCRELLHCPRVPVMAGSSLSSWLSHNNVATRALATVGCTWQSADTLVHSNVFSLDTSYFIFTAQWISHTVNERPTMCRHTNPQLLGRSLGI